MSSPRSGNTVHPFAWCAVVAGAGGGGELESVMAFPAYKEGVSRKIKGKVLGCDGDRVGRLTAFVFSTTATNGHLFVDRAAHVGL